MLQGSYGVTGQNEDRPALHSSLERRRVVFRHERSSTDHEWSVSVATRQCFDLSAGFRIVKNLC